MFTLVQMQWIDSLFQGLSTNFAVDQNKPYHDKMHARDQLSIYHQLRQLRIKLLRSVYGKMWRTVPLPNLTRAKTSQELRKLHFASYCQTGLHFRFVYIVLSALAMTTMRTITKLHKWTAISFEGVYRVARVAKNQTNLGYYRIVIKFWNHVK